MSPRHRDLGRLTPISRAGAAACALVLLAGTARAADLTWTGGGDGTTFTSNANWGNQPPPSTADTAIIGSGTPTVTTARTLTKLNVSGGTLGISGGGGRAVVSGGLTLSDSGIVQGAGILTLGGVSNQTGGTLNVSSLILQANAVYNISGGTIGTSTFVAGNGTSSIVQSGGTVIGLPTPSLRTGTYTQSGGTLAAAGVDVNTYRLTSTAATVNATKISAKVLFDLSAPTGTITIASILHDVGALTKSGGSTIYLTGINDYTGATTVSDGVLAVNGSIAASATTVTGGTLKGTGILGATTIQSLGTHAPGNSIGTETVAGNYANHGTLEIEVSPTAADKLVVQGTVDIGGATLSVLELSSTGWPPSRSFTIIDNDGSDAVSGSFGAIDSQLAFLVPTVNTGGGDGNDVVLTLLRNHLGFADLGTTANQLATAGALEALGNGDPLYEGILWSDPDTARAAYDQLSGEGFATAKGMLIDDAAGIEHQILGRVQQSFAALGATQPSNFVAGDGAPVSADGDRALWLSGYGARRLTASDGNAAASNGNAGGFLAGADGQLGAWTLGAFGGYGQSGVVIDGRATTISAQDLTAGAYAGTENEFVNVALGAAYSRHFLESRRDLTLPDAETLTASYEAGSAQLFGEIGHRIDLGALDLDPYAGLSYVDLATDSLAETGGAAALGSAASHTRALFTTLGLRAAASFVLGDDMLLKLKAGAAWQHAFADTPAASNNFIGGTPFTVAGTPLAADAALVELSADLNVSPSLSLSASYAAHLAPSTQSHALTASLTGKF